MFLCENYVNSYDVQLFIADNYKQSNMYKEAKACYTLANYMIPNRFIPLYNLMRIYEIENDIDRMLETAKIIVSKPVKIPSPMVDEIVCYANEALNTCKK